MTTVRPRLVIWIVLSAILYGGLIEWVQPWFGRTREAADLVADGLGAIAGGLCGYMLSDRFKR